MGIQDRDYYREKQWSKHDTKGQKPATSMSWKHFLGSILFLVLFALIILAIFDHYKPRHPIPSLVAENQSAAENKPRNCSSLPPHGLSYMFDPSMNRTDVLYSGLEIENDHDHPMIAIITDQLGSKRLLAISIAPSKVAQVTLPVGQYGMHVLLGSSWCNIEMGFSDGATATVAGGISIMVGSTTSMHFSGSGIRPIQLALAYSMSKPTDFQIDIQPNEVLGNGKLDLVQTKDGHYFSSGTVNGVPVVFMIDTGATVVSVSKKIASQAGIEKCAPQMTSTANGMVDACLAVVSEVTFGEFRLTNVKVMIMPDMSGNSLLGMNVLRNFHIEQIDKVMRISSR